MSQNIYKTASRVGLRVGGYSVEQLWSLKLQSPNVKEVTLDTLAIQLYNELKDRPSISFVSASKADKERDLNQLRLDVCIDIINTRKQEQDVNTQQAAALSEIKELEDVLIAARKKEITKLPSNEVEERIRQLKAQVAINNAPTL